MPDYSKSKLYFIRSHQTDLVYVGSTTQKLMYRFQAHKRDYKLYLEGKLKRICTSSLIVKYDDAYIELVKECPCDNKEQLHKFEGELIRNTECVNKYISGRNFKEWVEDNKEKRGEYMTTYLKQYVVDNNETIKAYKKQYYEKNKEKILDEAKVKMECECGSKINKGDLAQHKRTKKHTLFLGL